LVQRGAIPSYLAFEQLTQGAATYLQAENSAWQLAVSSIGMDHLQRSEDTDLYSHN
jgi:hypothetical protein